MPLLVPGRRFSSARPSGSSSCRSAVLLEMRHRDRQQRDGLLVGVIGEHRAHQLLGDLGKDRGRRDRRVERHRARDRAQVGEANAHRHRPAGPRFGAQPACATRSARWRSVGPEDPLLGRLPAERRLRAGRSRPPVRLDLARIAIPGQRRELLAGRGTEQPLERPSRRLRQLPDGEHADLGQPRLGDRAHAPHQLDRQVVQEVELGRRDRRPPARRAWPPARRSSPGAWCAPRRPRSAGRAPPARGAGSCSAISAGEPNRCVQPATSAKASSMEMRSTSGVKSSSTLMAASPSRW